MALAQSPELVNFDKLWDYNNPAETRKKFQEILPQAKASNDRSYYLQLLTQIARTYSLEDNFTEAHTLLDTVEKQLTPQLSLAEVRYLLERGRTFNSSDHKKEAVPLFAQAYEIASQMGAMRFAIDAVHMVAIAKDDPHEQIQWNLKGITLVENDSSQQGWLWALYNNIGESYLKINDYENAYKYFHLLSEYQLKQYGEPDIFTLKDESKALRLGGKATVAFTIIEPVYKKLESTQKEDGWISAEYAEVLYALGKKEEAAAPFKKAYQLLSADDYCKKYEPQTLARLKAMAE